MKTTPIIACPDTPGTKPNHLHTLMLGITLASLPLLTGCQDETLSSRSYPTSHGKVVFVEDLTSALAEGAPKLKGSFSSQGDTPPSLDATDLGNSTTPRRSFISSLINPKIEVQARSAQSRPATAAFVSVDPLAQANNQKDPLAPILVTQGWQNQLNEERPQVLGYQPK